MFRWCIEVTSNDSSLLPVLLQEPFFQQPKHSLIAEEGHYYLRSTDFESSATYAEVEPFLDKLLTSINQSIKLLFNDPNGLKKVGKSIYTDSASKPQEIITLKLDAQIRFRLRSDEKQLQKALEQHPNIMEKLSTINDPMVEEAMNCYNGPTNWLNLRKAFEVITKDIQQLIKNGQVARNSKLGQKIDRWTKDTQAFKFWESANNAGVSQDEALHPPATSTSLPAGFVGMNLDEANNFIRDLLIEWIESK